MPPVPVITPACTRTPGTEVTCDVVGCDELAMAVWQVARTGIIFGDRWVAGEDIELCRQHERRAMVMTGAEDYIEG
ncbi:hypothetical protein [Micromonospora sp. WMMD737]|uniref:hypothetical protein n=1 Tax=Micromonospora sp. WMMD737 TaxID=3404113 RepID=UPI003B954974